MKDDNANNYTLETMDSRDSIPYRQSNRYIAGSINGALLLEQIVYWYAKMGQKPFYKIKEPCDSPQYKTGQSWCEELGFSSREFDTAIKLIGQKISKKNLKDESVLVHYWVDFRRLTYYEINMDLYSRLKSEYYEKELIRLQSIDNEQTRKQQKRIYGDRKCGKRSYVNAESAVSVNAESASGSIREYLTENTAVCVENPPPTNPAHTQIASLTQNHDCIKLFNDKFLLMDITIEDLAASCIDHYQPAYVSVMKFKAWIKREKIENHSKKAVHTKKVESKFTEKEHEIIGQYKQAIKNGLIDLWFPDLQKRDHAKKLFEDWNDTIPPRG